MFRDQSFLGDKPFVTRQRMISRNYHRGTINDLGHHCQNISLRYQDFDAIVRHRPSWPRPSPPLRSAAPSAADAPALSNLLLRMARREEEDQKEGKQKK